MGGDIISAIAYLILLALCISLFFISIILYFKVKKEKKEEDKSKEYFRKRRKLLGKLKNRSYFIWLNKVLKEAEYPYGIRFEIYIIMMITALSGIIYTTYVSGMKSGLVVFMVSIPPLHLMIYKKYKVKRNKVKIALCDIQDIVYFQSKIGTSTDIILANCAKKAKNPLRIPLEKSVTCYKVTRNLEKSLEILEESSDLMEMKTFTIVLKQKEETGFSDENHRAQSYMMKRNKRLRKRLEREMKRNRLLVSAVLLFICYVLMLSGPILKSMYEGITKILN